MQFSLPVNSVLKVAHCGPDPGRLPLLRAGVGLLPEHVEDLGALLGVGRQSERAPAQRIAQVNLNVRPVQELTDEIGIILGGCQGEECSLTVAKKIDIEV